jgi:hypothetical protein
VAKKQAHEAAVRQQMVKDALELAAKRQTQSNWQANFGREQAAGAETARHNKALEAKQTPQQQISARVSELVGQGVPLLDASRQARQEAGRTTPYAPFSSDYIASAANLTKARQAAKGPPLARGTANSGDTPVRASQRERYLSQIADRAMEAAGGDVNKAATALVQEPATANIFSQGMGASHMNAAAARYKLRTMGKTPSGRPGASSKGILGDLVTPSPVTRPQSPLVNQQSTGATQQQNDWDEAAAALSQRGNHNPETVLGPRPQR